MVNVCENLNFRQGTAPAPVVSAGSETTVVPKVNVQVLNAPAGPFFKLTTTLAPAAPSIALSMSSTLIKMSLDPVALVAVAAFLT